MTATLDTSPTSTSATSTSGPAGPSPATAPADRPGRPVTAGGGDPFVLGLPLVVVGAIALGLQLVGYVDTTSVGSPLALIIGASGFGLLATTFWATRLEHVPAASLWDAGTSLPATILGVLSAFFLSYALLVLGLVHGWFGVAPTEVQHTQALFQISWLAVFVLLGVASLRLPAVFVVLFAAFSLVLALLLVATLGTSEGAGRAAGLVTLVIGAAAGYVFLSVSSAAAGGREYPLGPVVQQ